MAVVDGYRRRSLDELGDVALRMLVSRGAIPGGRQVFGCGQIGEALFSGQYQGAVNCSAPFARLAGRVMARLKEKGHARWIVVNDWSGWQATKEGVARSEV